MLVTGKPSLLFIAPWYLFPTDAGGKLRSADILKYLNRLDFSVTLLSPGPDDGVHHEEETSAVCDRFLSWDPVTRSRSFPYTRLRHIFSKLPIPVATDIWEPAQRVIRQALAEKPDIVVVDFVHTHILMPATLDIPSVVFTHNVEAEIFERHAEKASTPLHRWVWQNQFHKMVRFEGEVLKAYDQIVTVSERDTEIFQDRYGFPAGRISDISTGIDMERYQCLIESKKVDPRGGHLVFTASMNSAANIDAVEWFMDAVWPAVIAKRPDMRMTIVGRNPPAQLIGKASGLNWEFTGSVPSVEPFVHDADIFVVPLRVGGGTRLKIVEAIAMGAPIVSTDIGVEGIPLEPGTHFARANSPQEFADEIDALLADPEKRTRYAENSYALSAAEYGADGIAETFQEICHSAIEHFNAAKN